MTQATRSRARGAGKAQLHETALRLFARDGIEATSLQAIADEMGVSKAAVYYHYKTKDELVLQVIAPVFEQLNAVIDGAAEHRGRSARLDEFITGIAGLIVESHSRYSVVMRDPYVKHLLAQHHEKVLWWHRILALTDEPKPDPQTRAALMLFLAGMTAPLTDPDFAELSPDEQRTFFIESGRRLLQLRRRPA